MLQVVNELVIIIEHVHQLFCVRHLDMIRLNVFSYCCVDFQHERDDNIEHNQYCDDPIAYEVDSRPVVSNDVSIHGCRRVPVVFD